MANPVGAVIVPNNGGPANSVVNMNISANGGASQFGPMVAAPYYGMPMAPTYQPTPVGMGHPTYHPMSAGMGYSTHQPMPAGMGNPTYQPTPAAMGQSFFQPQPTHPRFQSIPCSEPQQESLQPGIYSPSLDKNGHASAQDRRQMVQAKEPAEQSEGCKETGLEEDCHISIQETGKPKCL